MRDHKPLPYDGVSSIRALLEGMERFGWKPVLEGDNIIGLSQNGASLSLEPGGQFELSGAPLQNVHETCVEVRTHRNQVREVCAEIGAGCLGIGYAPTWTLAEVPVMPKGRYAIMRNYMPKVGGYGLEMMFRTCTVQSNFDFSSERDMVQKLRVALALQPVATALFANSPFREGKPNGFLSYRSQIWTDVDNQRAGMLPFAFESGFGFERYVDYALDVPMYFVYRNGRYIDVAGKSFRDFLAGRIPELKAVEPHISDWADHLTTLFPEARIKILSGSARGRRRDVAAHLRSAGALGGDSLRSDCARCGLGHGQGLDRRGARSDARIRTQPRLPDTLPQHDRARTGAPYAGDRDAWPARARDAGFGGIKRRRIPATAA